MITLDSYILNELNTLKNRIDALEHTTKGSASLQPESDREYLDWIEVLRQAGVPVPIRLLTAATGGGSNILDLIEVLRQAGVPTPIRVFTAGGSGVAPQKGNLNSADVEWVVNDNGELGVKIGDQFFFLYKGESLQYCSDPKHDNGEPFMWRHVFKREFGECCHPKNAMHGSAAGVSLNDSTEWKPIP